MKTDFDLSKLEIARRKCEAKTARGNCFLDAESANAAACRMSWYLGKYINAYRCQMGAHWHLGCFRTEKERREKTLHERGISMALGFRIVRTPYPPSSRMTGIVVQKIRDDGRVGQVVGDEALLWDELQKALTELSEAKQLHLNECERTRSLQAELAELRSHSEKGRKR